VRNAKNKRGGGTDGTGKHVAGDDEVENKFRKVLKKLQSTGDRFTDEEYPPAPESLIEDWNSKTKIVREICEEWKQFRWIRAD